MEREETLAGVLHPEWLRPPNGPPRQRLDHPCTWPLEYGAPDLGWEGDNRLCLYANAAANTWELWRLEHDGEYRQTGLSSPPGVSIPGPEQINKLIKRLVDIDTRRGFDPHEESIVVARTIDEARAKSRSDRIQGDVAPKLRWALGRSYLPGVDVLPRQSPARR